jgi:hypothetical protein
MNSSSVTNADGSIVTIIRVHHHVSYTVVALAVLAIVCIGAGLYLLLRKQKTAC